MFPGLVFGFWGCLFGVEFVFWGAWVANVGISRVGAKGGSFVCLAGLWGLVGYSGLVGLTRYFKAGVGVQGSLIVWDLLYGRRYILYRCRDFLAECFATETNVRGGSIATRYVGHANEHWGVVG